MRLSHAVMNSNDPNATRDWYTNVLGFKLSDTLWGEHMGEMMHFMRCNDWHHSLAIARGPHTSVHHVSFEMRGLDEYMRGTGRVMRAGIKKIWGPGRHNAGNNTFSYFLDPSGNTMEYTTELEKLETDQWHPSVYDIADPMTQDVWGTVGPDVGDHRPRLLQRPRQGRLRRAACLMAPQLDGKVVVVTGAARGQGAEEVRALATAGATVVATDVLDFEPETPRRGLGRRERRPAAPRRHAPDGWTSLAAWLSAEHGRVDALVNNAGVAARERLPHVTLDAWQRDLRHQRHRPDARHPGAGPADAGRLVDRQHLLGGGAVGPRRGGVHLQQVGAARPDPLGVARARLAGHPGQRRDARPGRHPADGQSPRRPSPRRRWPRSRSAGSAYPPTSRRRSSSSSPTTRPTTTAPSSSSTAA